MELINYYGFTFDLLHNIMESTIDKEIGVFGGLFISIVSEMRVSITWLTIINCHKIKIKPKKLSRVMHRWNKSSIKFVNICLICTGSAICLAKITESLRFLLLWVLRPAPGSPAVHLLSSVFTKRTWHEFLETAETVNGSFYVVNCIDFFNQLHKEQWQAQHTSGTNFGNVWVILHIFI